MRIPKTTAQKIKFDFGKNLFKRETNQVITKLDTVPNPDWHFIEKFINLLSVFQIYFHTYFAATDLLSKRAHRNYWSLGVWRSSCNSTLLLYRWSDFRQMSTFRQLIIASFIKAYLKLKYRDKITLSQLTLSHSNKYRQLT